MIRDEYLLVSMRPPLALPIHDEMTGLEKFQNETLRPILKLQNELLLALLDNAPHFKRIKHAVSTAEDYKAEVIAFIRQQAALKNQVIGVVVGHFTMDEYRYYAHHANELNKRIVQMAGERVAVWP